MNMSQSGKCEVIYTSYDILLPKDQRDFCTQNEDWYIIQCPKCLEDLNYKKEKLYLSKSLDYGYCHRCSRVFIDRFTLYTNPDIKVPNFSEYLSQVRCTDHLDSFKGMNSYFQASEVIDEKAIDYLNSRGNLKLIREYKRYQLRFSNDGIYIPFLFPEAKYYIKRLYEPLGGMKYFLPPIKSKPFYFLDRGSDTFVICEGPFDSIAIDLVFNNPNVIGVMGSTMTNAQINSFRDLLPENIVIWLDDTSLSEKLKLKLKARIPYADFKVIESSGDDPEELLIDKLK